MKPSTLFVSLCLCGLVLHTPWRATAAPAERAELLTDASVRLTAARYAPGEAAFDWDGWIGAGLGLVRYRGTSAFVDGDIETVLGNERRAFEANQANYHLQLGMRRAFRWGEGALLYYHVSRHSVDRAKEVPVDWNQIAFQGRRSYRLGERVPSRLLVRLGRIVQVSTVGYRWEAVARTEHDMLARDWGTGYVSGDVRFMKTETSERFPRTGFVDAKLEAGLRFVRDRRIFEAFVGLERRNDVLLLENGARRWLVVGVRLGLSGGEAQRGPSSPPGSSPWCSLK
jgi:hypothetical protein